MKIQTTALAGLLRIKTQPHCDERGAFARLFCDQALAAVMGERRLVQINHSRTSAVGALRGLHYQQPPHAEMKLIRCLKGRVWDVAVDLRQGSPTFLCWHAEELDAAQQQLLVIPEGFAHGFQVLEPDSELLYLHTAHYNQQAEVGLRFDDPRLAIPWPLAVTDLSARDSSHALIDDHFCGVQA